MYVLLLFITVFMRLSFIRRRSRFLQRLRLLTLKSKMRRTEACSFQLRRKFRKKKIAWVLERPQFWFKHMVLSHYENNIWREHFRISRQTFRFVCDLVRPHLARQDTNMRRAIPVEKRVAVALWRLATGNSYRSTGLVFGDGRCTSSETQGLLAGTMRYFRANFRRENYGRVLVPSPHVKACDFLGFFEYFFLKLSTTIFPLHGPSNQVDR